MMGPSGIVQVLGWDGNRSVGLRLGDGRKATIFIDAKGVWRFEAAPEMRRTDRP